MPESYKEDERPAQQWYWNDWFSAFDVRNCCLAARGLWIDMLGIMWKAEIRGTLTVNGKQPDNKTLANIVGSSISKIKPLLKELEMNNVFSRLDDGTIICRRMFRESAKKDDISKIRSKAGKEGAKKRWQNDGKTMAKHGKKNLPLAKGNGKTMAKITEVEDGKSSGKKMAKMAASSSTSSSTSSSKKECSEKHSELAALLESKIKERLPRHKFTGKRYLEEWANEFRIMEERKEATAEEIRKTIIWVSKDDFWYKNIKSAAKLRKQFGVLWAEMEEDKKKRGVQSEDEFDEMQEKAMEERK